MSNRRVKNIAFGDDDLDDDYEEDYEDVEQEQELSPAERLQMKASSDEVKTLLGKDYDTSEKEIEETLYYYYFDVDKTVSYIKNQRKPKPTKKPITTAAPSTKAGGPKRSQSPQRKSAETAKVLVPEQIPRKRKSLDVLKEFEHSAGKKQASFVVVGHVDHGKSTLMGRLLLDLKVTNQRSIDKLQKEADIMGKSSFALAWVMDETPEERSSGITVGFATKHFETDNARFTILDAPGHQDFVPNMIAGASQADFAVLVTDAATNGFESGLKGQTKEHAMLVRSIGIQRLIVVVNKMDAASWNESRFSDISQQMTTFLLSAGFSAKNITFIPCAGLTGENVVRSIAPGLAPWYKGGTLVSALESQQSSLRPLESPLRMTVTNLFREAGSLSVTGRLESGYIQIGETVKIMPSGVTTAINAILVDDEVREWAVAGQIASVALLDVDPANLRAGDVICSVSAAIANMKACSVKVLAFQHIMPMLISVHRGPLDMSARVTSLEAILDKTTGNVDKKKPRVIQPGAAARISIELEIATPLEKGNRIVLRSEGNTIAAGLIE